MQAQAKLTTGPDPARHSGRGFPIRHLAVRFFTAVTADGPGPAAQDEIAALLTGDERDLFFTQSPADQEHAHRTMRRAGMSTDDPVVLRAALLHDVGKAGNRLGPVFRSLATVLDALGLPLWPAARDYRNHGVVGARRLAALGVEPLAVDFAARHPDPDPGPHDPESWHILLAADHV